MALHAPITLDGLLDDWLPGDRIDKASTLPAGFSVLGTADAIYFTFALTAPIAIGANTTLWLNTDRNAATGYQVFGFAGGAEYNINFAADGTASLFTGGVGETLIASGLHVAFSADHTIVEVQVEKSAIGNPSSIDVIVDVNDQAFLPASYSDTPMTVFNDIGVAPATDHRVGIVWSDTTAKAFFSEGAYAQLFMSAQNQVMQAGLPFDILTESDLTNLTTLAKYDTLVFPSFRNVAVGQAQAITNALQQATTQFGIGLVAAGEFMTNAADNSALPGDSYARMKLLFDVTRVTGGTGDVTLASSDSGHLVLDAHAPGETIRSYTNVGWNAFASVSGTGTTIATETVGGQTYAAAIASTTGGRNVLFATEGVMADSNMLWQAIDYSVNGSGPSVGLQMTRQSAIVASRNDMDQSQYADEVDPAGTTPGIYDKLLPLLTQWKQQYGFVGSYYINVGDNPAQLEATNWAVSGPYYQQLLALGNEIGSHSYTHPENTNTLSAEQIAFEFGQAKTVIEQQMSALLGTNFEVAGAAVPGAPETLATSKAILPYVGDYLSGGYSGVGAGYPGAIGYLSPDATNAVYIAPNVTFDFTLVGFQGKTAAQADAAWSAEWAALTAKGEAPVVVWPWHDYGPTLWDADGTGQPSRYSTEMFTNFIAHAHSAGAEFVTLADLAQRVQSLSHATITSTVAGDTITATVAAADAGLFALDVDGQGAKVIKSVAGWYAFDNDSVFLPQAGGTYTITLGAAADDVTHITALPMRASLISVAGDGRNLAFSVVGEGRVTVDLAAPGTSWITVSGASVASQAGEVMTLDLGPAGRHDVSITYDAGAAPVITSGGGGASVALTLAENTAVVTTVLATDSDIVRGDRVSYALASGGDSALFSIDAATGVLAFRRAPDFELPGDVGRDNVYDLVVTATDLHGLVDTQALSIRITDLADTAPVITSNGGGASSALSVAENTTAVTLVAAADPDASLGDRITYGLTGGDAALFTINPISGALAFRTAPDFEAPADGGRDNVYDLVVTATDSTGLADTQALSIRITNLADTAPVITSNGGGATATLTVAENTTAVTLVTASDADASLGDRVTFGLATGGDAALFTINATTGALAFRNAPDFEAPADIGRNNVYDVTVTARDSTGLVDIQALAIKVTDVVEAPSGRAPVITSNGSGATATVTVAENISAVTTIVASDPGDKVTFGLKAGGDAPLFAIDPVSGALSFRSAPDFETPADIGRNNVYDVVVTATDSTGLIDTQALAIKVTDVVAISRNGTGKADTFSGASEGDRYDGGAGDDVLNGLGGNDSLIGGTGNDRIDGGTGDDTITGGAGVDTLSGGAGRDLFRYTSVSDSTTIATLRDVITDYKQGEDRIDLSQIDANLWLRGDQAFNLKSAPGAALSSVGDLRFSYVTIGGVEHTIIEGVTALPYLPDFSIDLVGRHALTTSDFIL